MPPSDRKHIFQEQFSVMATVLTKGRVRRMKGPILPSEQYISISGGFSVASASRGLILCAGRLRPL